MGLARHDELRGTVVVGENAAEPIGVVKQEIRAFIRSEAPRKPESEDIGVEVDFDTVKRPISML